MMNSTQFLDLAVHKISALFARAGERKRKNAVSTLLERLGICRSPRILSAVCLPAREHFTFGGYRT